MILIGRKEAISKSLATYFTGKPCIHGHISQRFTANKTCAECLRSNSTKRRLDSSFVEKHKKYMDDYNEKNKEEILQYRRDKLKLDPQYRKEESKRQSEWAKNNKSYFREKWSRDTATRRGAKLLTVNLKLTKEFCKECPQNLTIDHIIPVSKGGIHDISNLQYLEHSINSSKRDKANIPVNGIYCLPCDPEIFKSNSERLCSE